MIRFTLPRDLEGIHYAIRILIGSGSLWFLLTQFGDKNPLWAVISLIAVTEPKMRLAWLAFRSRTIHTCVGCATGFTFLLLANDRAWTLPIALTITALISSYVTRINQGWRVAPTTTALIMSAGMTHSSALNGLDVAISRTFEVLLGSAAALVVTWLMSLIWAPKDMPAAPPILPAKES